MKLLRFFALGLLLVSSLAWGQTYPDKAKPIRIILPQGPGSASDVLTRAFARAITETSGLNTVIDFKPGAETVIGVQALMNSPADGYTILLVSSSTPVLNPVMIANLPYDPLRDFIPLVGISKASLAFNLGVSTQFKSVGEFMAAAKDNLGLQEQDTAQEADSLPTDLHSAARMNEHQVIMATLASTPSKTEAAKRLGISPRTLRYKMAQLREHGLGMASAAY